MLEDRADATTADLLGAGLSDGHPRSGGREHADGLLRVEVGGGGDGSGTVDFDSPLAPNPVLRHYTVIADDGTPETQIIEQVHAGDDEVNLEFVYTPIETIGDGELQFTVPSGWTYPQADSSSEPGYTTVGPVVQSDPITFNGASLTVPIYRLDDGQYNHD